MKDTNPADNLAWRAIWRQLISSVGSQAGTLRRSLVALRAKRTPCCWAPWMKTSIT